MLEEPGEQARGIAIELGAAGATVYVTGRTTRMSPSEYNRPETIEETAELVDQAGGTGIAVQVDHLDPVQVQALIARIEREQGQLDILVNDIWGGEYMVKWNVPVWSIRWKTVCVCCIWPLIPISLQATTRCRC